MENWEKYYKLPLKLDPTPYTSYAWCRDDSMALTFAHAVTREEARYIIEVINGTQSGGFENIRYDDTEFFINNIYTFQIRGWGNLTGTGGHHLSEDVAEKIHMDFRDYVYSKLKHNNE